MTDLTHTLSEHQGREILRIENFGRADEADGMESQLIPHEPDNVDSDNHSSSAHDTSFDGNLETESNTPITPTSSQLHILSLSQHVECERSSLATALDLASLHPFEIEHLAAANWLERSQSGAFAKGINVELRHCNLETWADYFDAVAHDMNKVQQIMFHEDDIPDESPLATSHTGVTLQDTESQILPFSPIIDDTMCGTGSMASPSTSANILPSETYFIAEDIEVEEYASDTAAGKKIDNNRGDDEGSRSLGKEAEEIITTLSPNLRQFIPQEMGEILTRVFRAFPPEYQDGPGKVYAQGVIDYYYMSRASQQARVSGCYTPLQLTQADRSVDWFWKIKDKYGNCAYDPRKLTIRPKLQAPKPESPRTIHHLNFNREPVYHKSTTPPEVSMWAAFTSGSPVKACYRRPTRERVLASQAAKLIDPFYYSGPEELLNLRGTKLREAVAGYVTVVYEACGTWESDRYELNNAFPRSVYELSHYDKDCGLKPVPGYKISNEQDGDILINDDGRSHPVTRGRTRNLLSRSRLCVVQNANDGASEAKMDDDLLNLQAFTSTHAGYRNVSRSCSVMHQQSEDTVQADDDPFYVDASTDDRARTTRSSESNVASLHLPDDVMACEMGIPEGKLDDGPGCASSYSDSSKHSSLEWSLPPSSQIADLVVKKPVDVRHDENRYAQVDCSNSPEEDLNDFEETRADLYRTEGGVTEYLCQWSDSPERVKRIQSNPEVSRDDLKDRRRTVLNFIPGFAGWRDEDYITEQESHSKMVLSQEIGSTEDEFSGDSAGDDLSPQLLATLQQHEVLAPLSSDAEGIDFNNGEYVDPVFDVPRQSQPNQEEYTPLLPALLPGPGKDIVLSSGPVLSPADNRCEASTTLETKGNVADAKLKNADLQGLVAKMQSGRDILPDLKEDTAAGCNYSGPDALDRCTPQGVPGELLKMAKDIFDEASIGPLEKGEPPTVPEEGLPDQAMGEESAAIASKPSQHSENAESSAIKPEQSRLQVRGKALVGQCVGDGSKILACPKQVEDEYLDAQNKPLVEQHGKQQGSIHAPETKQRCTNGLAMEPTRCRTDCLHVERETHEADTHSSSALSGALPDIHAVLGSGALPDIHAVLGSGPYNQFQDLADIPGHLSFNEYLFGSIAIFVGHKALQLTERLSLRSILG